MNTGKKPLEEDGPLQLVGFTLEQQRYALYLDAVERVFHAVEVTPLPNAPAVVLGVVNVAGEPIPVVNPRMRFGLPRRDLSVHDPFVLARSSRRRVILVVDAVSGVMEASPQRVVDAERILPHLEHVRGIAKLENGLVLIHDLDTFLSLEEDDALGQALQADRR